MIDRRPTTRMAVALMALSFVRALVPIAPGPQTPLPAQERLAGETSFACSQHECGCRSSEQCHRACCCTDDELDVDVFAIGARAGERDAVKPDAAGHDALAHDVIARYSDRVDVGAHVATAIRIADRRPEFGARTSSSAASRARAILTSLACRGGLPGESWRQARAPIAITPAPFGRIAAPHLAANFASDVRSLRSAAPRDPLVPPPRAAITA